MGDTIVEAIGPPKKIAMGQPNVVIGGQQKERGDAAFRAQLRSRKSRSMAAFESGSKAAARASAETAGMSATPFAVR